MKLKRWLLTLSLAVLSLSVLAPQIAEAKRLGGGGTSGMRRDVPSRSPDTTPSKAPAAAPTTPPATTAPATPPKRSWMGPIAGLAAGLGIAALMSHFGLGAGLGNFLTILLVALLAFVAIRFLLRRFGPRQAPGGMQFAGAPGAYAPPAQPSAFPWGRGGDATAGSSAAAATPAPALPAGFDAPAFERSAKLIFIRMQAANDVADLNDLRAFTTPEMFAAVKLDLQERAPGKQHTDVVKLNAEVVDVSQDTHQQIVSVRFHGLLREEEAQAAPAPFDEVWHLVRPLDGSREWAIAGIAPYA